MVSTAAAAKSSGREAPENQPFAYARTRSRIAPPSIRCTGTPSARADTSHSAISSALSAVPVTGPPRQ